jgi:hypothetical protein
VADDYVPREVVLKAARAAGPPHSPKKLIVLEDTEGYFVTISDGKKWTLKEFIPPEVARREINHLIARFKIPRIWFYEPLTIPGEEEEKPC